MSQIPRLSPRAAAAATTAIALLTPGTAVAAPQWTSPTTLTAPLTSGQIVQQITSLTSGQPLISWAEGSSSGSFSSMQQTAPGAFTPAGFTAAAVPGGFLPAPDERVQISALPNGGALAAWRTYDSDSGSLQIAASNYDAVTGAWSTPVLLVPTGGFTTDTAAFTRPSLAVSPSGAVAIAVMQGLPADPPQITVWRRAAGSTAWSAPEAAPADLSDGYASGPDNAAGIALAFGPDEALTAAWTAQKDGSMRVFTATRSAAGSWSAPVAHGFDGGYPLATALAVAPSGRATLTWTDMSLNAAFATDQPAGTTTWSEPTSLSPFPFMMLPGISLSMNAAGDLAVGMLASGGSPLPIVATRPATGDWETTLPSFAPSFTSDYSPAIAIDGNGDTTVATMSGPSTITALRKRAGSSSWTARSFYGPLGTPSLRVGADAHGSATLAWTAADPENGDPIVKAATFDGTGPIQSGVTIPSTAKVDVPSAFSLSAKDVASATGATTWSFGDDSTATGTSANHTYRAPGTYTVKATSVDALGNESVITREVTVDGASCAGSRKGRTVTVKCDLGFDPGDKVKVNGRIQRVRADGKLALVRAKTRTTTSTGKFTLVFKARGVRKGTYAVTIAPRTASKQVVQIGL